MDKPNQQTVAQAALRKRSSTLGNGNEARVSPNTLERTLRRSTFHTPDMPTSSVFASPDFVEIEGSPVSIGSPCTVSTSGSSPNRRPIGDTRNESSGSIPILFAPPKKISNISEVTHPALVGLGILQRKSEARAQPQLQAAPESEELERSNSNSSGGSSVSSSMALDRVQSWASDMLTAVNRSQNPSLTTTGNALEPSKLRKSIEDDTESLFSVSAYYGGKGTPEMPQVPRMPVQEQLYKANERTPKAGAMDIDLVKDRRRREITVKQQAIFGSNYSLTPSAIESKVLPPLPPRSIARPASPTEFAGPSPTRTECDSALSISSSSITTSSQSSSTKFQGKYEVDEIPLPEELYQMRLLIDQEGFREINPIIRFTLWDRELNMLEFRPVEIIEYPYHQSTMQNPPVLRSLRMLGKDTKDFLSRQATLPIKELGVYFVEGSEGKGKWNWQFAYEVKDRYSLAGKHLPGEKTVTPILFTCSPEILEAGSRRKKGSMLSGMRKSLAPKLEAAPVSPTSPTKRRNKFGRNRAISLPLGPSRQRETSATPLLHSAPSHALRSEMSLQQAASMNNLSASFLRQATLSRPATPQSKRS